MKSNVHNSDNTDTLHPKAIECMSLSIKFSHFEVSATSRITNRLDRLMVFVKDIVEE